MSASTTVLVTGASGFIGIHVVRVLLKEGYRVRGTVRSLKNDTKCKPILECHPDAKTKLQLVEADLTKDEGWEEAVRGVKYVIHVASPFPNFVPKDPDSLVRPAVDGTLRVLKAAARAGVARVALTSSIASIHGHLETDNVTVYNETEWADLESPTLGPYERSKTLAEKAAWEFIKSPENASKMELVTILPALVIGPIVGTDFGTSVMSLKRLIDGSSPMVPGVTFAFCDVRDVAEAHVKSLTVKEAAGERICVCTETLWMQEVSKILHKEFGSMGYRCPQRKAPNFGLWFISWIDATVAMLMPRLDKVFKYSNEKMKTILKIQPRPIETSIVDTAYSLIDAGVVRKTSKYQPKKVEL
ncbi:dihydroflavonol 4-reductase-like [Galendromus occidentalis]|uniref:Dihydroflavonol 4-reductase-like n=1 Tax=Galendromus occidentalis TaxID=34638 RepID=A0AAJ6QUM1_9ACAR|nr:dihydroflavonol 4-reductase-like [Galendromus occidentalis]